MFPCQRSPSPTCWSRQPLAATGSEPATRAPRACGRTSLATAWSSLALWKETNWVQTTFLIAPFTIIIGTVTTTSTDGPRKTATESTHASALCLPPLSLMTQPCQPRLQHCQLQQSPTQPHHHQPLQQRQQQPLQQRQHQARGPAPPARRWSAPSAGGPSPTRPASPRPRTPAPSWATAASWRCPGTTRVGHGSRVTGHG